MSPPAMPKDAQVMMAILKDMGVTDHEPRIINLMLEFCYRYICQVLEDSKVYSNHAGKRVIDVDDVKLAIQLRMDHSFTTPPPKEFLMEVARQKNTQPLPLIKTSSGLRLPPDRYTLVASNYKLKSQNKKMSFMSPSEGISSSAGPSSLTTTKYMTLSSGNSASLELAHAKNNEAAISRTIPGASPSLVKVSVNPRITPLQRIVTGVRPANATVRPQSTAIRPRMPVTTIRPGVGVVPSNARMPTGVKRKAPDDPSNNSTDKG